MNEPFARLEKVTKQGWCWNMWLVRLRDGSALVYSPTVLDDGFTRVDAIGEPRVLFAPNNYHHMSLGAYRARYPAARVVASAQAIPRLSRQKHAGVEDMRDVESLVDGRFLACEGTRTGEAWISSGDTLLVCDAFFNVNHPLREVVGFALKRLRVAPGLRISRTFQLLALKDKRRYREWARETIRTLAPRRLLLSHGDPVEVDDLPGKLDALLEKELR